MTYVITAGTDRVVVVEMTPPAICDICGVCEELRPYGPNGENICYTCGEKNEPVTTQMMEKALYGKEIDK